MESHSLCGVAAVWVPAQSQLAQDPRASRSLSPISFREIILEPAQPRRVYVAAERLLRTYTEELLAVGAHHAEHANLEEEDILPANGDAFRSVMYKSGRKGPRVVIVS